MGSASAMFEPRGRVGTDESDEVWCVHRAPAGLS